MTNQDLSQYSHSFSLKNKIGRLLWQMVWLFFFRPFCTPLFKKYRVLVLKCFGANIDWSSHIYASVKIWAPWNLIVENEVGVADGVDLYSQGKITLEYRVIISQRSYICTGTHDFTQKGHPLYTRPIRVCKNAWVAAEAFMDREEVVVAEPMP